MDDARALVELEAQALRTGTSPRNSIDELRAAPPSPIDVIVPPAPGSVLARAYEELEQEKLVLVRELGRVHLACVVAELEDVVRAIQNQPLANTGYTDYAAARAEHEQEQLRLHNEWTAEIRSIIDRKLGIE